MKKIHLIKSAQAIPFVNTLDQIGAPVERFARRAALPLSVIRKGRGVIGEYAVWEFVEHAAKSEGYELFGFDCAQHNPVTSLGELGGLRMRLAPSLKMILQYFIEDARAESTGAFYSLRTDVNSMWFSRLQMFGKIAASWQVEQYMISTIIQIVRICAGPAWLPPEIRISATNKAQRLPNEWSQCKLIWGCEATELQIPYETLALAPVLLDYPTSDINISQHDRHSEQLNFVNFIQTQIYSRHLRLEILAEQLGLSPKTFKRRLAYMNTNFTEIVDQVRLKIGRSRLETSNASIHIIATDLGYQHQANFTRAFKRMSGITPHEYRKRAQA